MIDILCKNIIKQLAINRIVETGTDKGETIAETSRWFAEFYPDFGKVIRNEETASRSYDLSYKPISYPVFGEVKPDDHQIYSVDADEYSYRIAQERFKSNINICLFHSSSEVFLRSLLEREAKDSNNYLFFLDAHWGKYWPLRDKVKVIRQLNKYLIVIDDFFVPGKSDAGMPHGKFGFDLYQSTILCWGYLCDLFYNMPVRIFYPNGPNRDNRGWVLLAHGYNDAELDFLKSLDLFEMDSFDKNHAIAVKTVWRSHWDAKNILKTMVPVNVLRALHRVYERVVG